MCRDEHIVLLLREIVCKQDVKCRPDFVHFSRVGRITFALPRYILSRDTVTTFADEHMKHHGREQIELVSLLVPIVGNLIGFVLHGSFYLLCKTPASLPTASGSLVRWLASQLLEPPGRASRKGEIVATMDKTGVMQALEAVCHCLVIANLKGKLADGPRQTVVGIEQEHKNGPVSRSIMKYRSCARHRLLWES